MGKTTVVSTVLMYSLLLYQYLYAISYNPNKVCLHVDTDELTRDALSAKGITENHIPTHTQTHRRSLVCLQTD